jgi:hypothetical protein
VGAIPVVIEMSEEAAAFDDRPEPVEPTTPSYRYVQSSIQSSTPLEEQVPELRLRRSTTRLLLDSSERDEPQLPHTPLLRASSTRAILAASLATDVVAGSTSIEPSDRLRGASRSIVCR